ncbi:hypothetical protein J6590_052968 [Homalodisca vitripennis]|nr:hypothetical protein J6590_052967 [Homalodisca vitripennis]KAG8267369.1 hypothetical protein J6590_052968 [Homalodisca vitripennis]
MPRPPRYLALGPLSVPADTRAGQCPVEAVIGDGWPRHKAHLCQQLPASRRADRIRNCLAVRTRFQELMLMCCLDVKVLQHDLERAWRFEGKAGGKLSGFK